jgi:hypothetical protein
MRMGVSRLFILFLLPRESKAPRKDKLRGADAKRDSTEYEAK